MAEKIQHVLIEQEMKDSYLDYSMSVIVGRALPDARDGLKPVHRRILYAMHSEGLHYHKKFTKCAGVVGSVLKSFHPHGDSSVYDALVRLAQSWSLRYPLITGQGNFGSQDGDPPAAYRYTEAKLAKLAEKLLQDIDRNTVPFVDNFDGSTQEPVVLPTCVPNLLMNGSTGIAVGMATNIPPHNLHELIQGALALIQNPNIDWSELTTYVRGPDFPTGGIVCGTQGIKKYMKTGKGKVLVRAKINFEDNAIVVTELPYMVNKSLLLQSIATHIKEKSIEGISDLRDESDRQGMRIVIFVKHGYQPDVVLNQLYKHTSLQTTFGVQMLSLVGGQPQLLGLKELLRIFLDHRRDVIVRRTQFELEKAEARQHILEGLRIALHNLDAVIALIKGSSSPAEAKDGLITQYALSEIQSQAILDMKLQRLTALEQDKIEREYRELVVFVVDLRAILASEERQWTIVRDELCAIAEEFGDERRTFILEDYEEVDDEDLIEVEDVVLTVTQSGYVKRLPVDTYRSQKRGGKGIIGTGMREEDVVDTIIVCNTHSTLLVFTSHGQVHWMRPFMIPEGSRYSKGTAFVNLLPLAKDEHVYALIAVNDFDPERYLIFVTRDGLVKKTSLDLFSRPRRGGIRSMTLRDGDELVSVRLTSGNDMLLVATRHGRAVRFHENDVRPSGRSSMGVRAIRVRDSAVIGMEICDKPHVLTITEMGYGKCSPVEDYRLINRGGSGVINLKVTDKNGPVVAVRIVSGSEDILLMSEQGIVIRFSVKDISVIGRNTQGVRVMRLSEGDKVVSVAVVNEE